MRVMCVSGWWWWFVCISYCVIVFSSVLDQSSIKGVRVRVSHVKPSHCFMRPEKLVLPSIFDTCISSFMT